MAGYGTRSRQRRSSGDGGSVGFGVFGVRDEVPDATAEGRNRQPSACRREQTFAFTLNTSSLSTQDSAPHRQRCTYAPATGAAGFLLCHGMLAAVAEEGHRWPRFRVWPDVAVFPLRLLRALQGRTLPAPMLRRCEQSRRLKFLSRDKWPILFCLATLIVARQRIAGHRTNMQKDVLVICCLNSRKRLFILQQVKIESECTLSSIFIF